ncbi:MAG: holo-[acyl-carrier-protein] synthase [Candidatus Aminicenantes bacterium]|nr:holo-[acyl-carrier-protein] synthase [Candidatus Aminicenantes bacterium]
MIKGVGIDIIEVGRIRNSAEKDPRFLQRIFTPQEITYCQGKKNKYQHLAARFASKEALFKALGKRIKWTDVDMVNLNSGKPQLNIKAKERYSFRHVHVSVSHLADYAAAVVILEEEE